MDQTSRPEPAGSDRKAVQVRVPLERYEAWERAAHAAGAEKVSVWLAHLADVAVRR